MCRNQIKRNARIQPSACLQIQAALTGGAPLFCWWRGAAFPTDGGAPLCWKRGAAFLLVEGRRSALACGWRGDSLGRRFPDGVGAALGACLRVEGRLSGAPLSCWCRGCARRLPAGGGATLACEWRMERRRVEGRRILVGGAGFGFEGRACGEGTMLGRAGGERAARIETRDFGPARSGRERRARGGGGSGAILGGGAACCSRGRGAAAEN
jgi:hypothetical protein